MTLKIKEIQEKLDLVFKRFRAKGNTFDTMMVLREFSDQLIDELTWLERRNIKYKTKEEEIVSEEQEKSKKTEKVNEALKMNNPLRYV